LFDGFYLCLILTPVLWAETDSYLLSFCRLKKNESKSATLGCRHFAAVDKMRQSGIRVGQKKTGGCPPVFEFFDGSGLA
jgi:hypothetical protein